MKCTIKTLNVSYSEEVKSEEEKKSNSKVRNKKRKEEKEKQLIMGLMTYSLILFICSI